MTTEALTEEFQPQPDPTETMAPKEPCPFEIGQVVMMNGQNVDMTVEGFFSHPAAPIWIVSLVWFTEDNVLQRDNVDARLLQAI